jgi:hypothetical protein
MSIATEVVRGMNSFARYDLATAQEAMGAPDLKVEMYHILSFLLSFCSHQWESLGSGGKRGGGGGEEGGGLANVQCLLEEVLLLTGYFCLLQPAHQDVMRWGTAPTILQKLCSVPFVYFSDPRFVPVLFPTLIAATFSNEQNKEVIQCEMSLEMLNDFLKDQLKDPDPDKPVSSGDSKFNLRERFPTALLSDAEDFFSS